MRSVLWAAALAAGAAAPAFAQEGGAIRTGEHDRFTRVVMIIAPTTEWSLETGPDRATIFFPGRRLAFGTAGAFDRIPRTRVTAIETAVTDAGTRVSVALGCDCRISTSFVGARYLALDVGDRDAPHTAAEDAAAREQRETEAVASAELALLAQITRAADQGVVRLARTEHEADAEDEDQAGPPGTEAAAGSEAERAASPASSDAPPETVAALDLHDQIEAISVFDRDRAAVAALRPAPEVPPVCLPDEALDVGAWSDGRSFAAQTPALMRRLVGEFDVPDPEAVRDLARLYVRFGFGVEAETLVAGFDIDAADAALLTDLARAVEGRPVGADGPLALDDACPGRHGLWLAVGGAAPAFHDPAQFASVQAAYAELPVDLRALIAPQLVLGLIDAGRPEEARLIHLTATRTGRPPDVGLQRAAARLAAAEGRIGEAELTLRLLVEGNAANAIDALIDLARLALDAGVELPAPMVTDLAAAALTQRGDPRETRLRGLLVETLAARGALTFALAEARTASADLPAGAPGFAALAAAALAAADPVRVGPAIYAAAALGNADLVPVGRSGDAARLAIAARLVEVGLPNAAITLIAPAVLRGDAAALRLAARAYLDLGDPAAALATAGALDDPEAIRLRAEALARGGSPGDAVSLLAESGAEAETAPYAWPSGDWARARTSDDPNRAAMADFMARRPATAPVAPDADPSPEAAFQAPLPSLAAPSLGAARQLLANGPGVESFLESALEPRHTDD